MSFLLAFLVCFGFESVGLCFPPGKVNNPCGVPSRAGWQGELAVCVTRQKAERTSRDVSA